MYSFGGVAFANDELIDSGTPVVNNEIDGSEGLNGESDGSGFSVPDSDESGDDESDEESNGKDNDAGEEDSSDLNSKGFMTMNISQLVEKSNGNPGKLHIMHPGAPTLPFYVTFSYNGDNYSSNTVRNGDGGAYDGQFVDFPSNFTKEQLQSYMTITILNSNATVTFNIKNVQANGTINIDILGITYPDNRTYDLVVNKSADLYTVTKGSIVTFTITAKNDGNTTITGVSVEDEWTNGLTELTLVSENGNGFDTTTGIWDVGSIGPNNSDIKTLVVSAKANLIGVATNTAIGSLNEDETGQEPNQSSIEIEIYDPITPPEKTYDLVIDKKANHTTVTKGSIVTFTITAKNAGNTTITGVTVEDEWTDGLTELGLESQNGISFNTSTGIWTVGSIGPNNSETKTLVITAKADKVGTATNTAVGTLTETETGQGANTDSAVIEITESTIQPTPKNDLSITKLVDLSSVTVGTGVTFIITVTNIGDTTMEAIEVKDTWPSGLVLGTATPHEGTSFTTEGNIWNVETLAPGESKTLTIAAGTPTAGTFTNNVEIFQKIEGSSPLDDDNDANNTAAAIVTVTNPGTTGGGGGGGTGGGGGGETTTTITDPEPPLAEIPETETPLVEAPEVVLEEQPIPLADVPQTGDNTNIWLLLALMMGSGAGIVLLGRRKETVEK